MPLILVCGLPCTGKTTFTQRLASFLSESGLGSIEVINEESEGVVKRDGHKTSANEKATRGLLKSRVIQKLNAETTVIVDYLNYIKGYRYELHCAAKTFRTPHCLVWVQCDETNSNNWNQDRFRSKGEPFAYEESILNDLRRRFEPPNEKNRWDSPLFVVNMNPSLDPTLSQISPSQDSNIVSTLSINTPQPHPSTSLSTSSTVKSSWKPKSKKTTTIPTPTTTPSLPTPSLSSSESPGVEPGTIGDATLTSLSLSTSLSSSSSSSSSVFDFSIDPIAAALATSSLSSPPSSSTSSETQEKSKHDEGNGLYFSGTRSTVLSHASSTSDRMEDVLPKILQYLTTAAAPIPNASTVTIQHATAEKLYELDSISKKIVDAIVFHQNQGHEGTPVIFHEYNRTLALHRPVGVAELQRHRRHFVKVNGLHPPESNSEIGVLFIEFLASQL